MNKKQTDKRTLCNSPNDLVEWLGSTTIKDKASAVRVSERTVCDPFLKHATVGYVVTWLSLVTT